MMAPVRLLTANGRWGLSLGRRRHDLQHEQVPGLAAVGGRRLAEAKIDRLSGVEDNSRFVACASGGCGFKRAKSSDSASDRKRGKLPA